MSEREYIELSLANELIVLIDMKQSSWTISGIETLIWFDLTPYYKRFIRLAANDIIYALAISQTLGSIQASYENALAMTDNNGFFFQWHDPKLSPFTLIVSSEAPNIQHSPAQYDGMQAERYTASSMGMQVDIRKCQFENSTKSYYTLTLNQQGENEYFYGKFQKLQQACKIGEDLVADPNSQPPMPSGNFQHDFIPVTLANDETYYFHEALIQDDLDPSFQWLISKTPIDNTDILEHSKFSYYRKNGLSKDASNNIHYLGDMTMCRLIANAAVNESFIKSVEEALHKELA